MDENKICAVVEGSTNVVVNVIVFNQDNEYPVPEGHYFIDIDDEQPVKIGDTLNT